MTTLHDRNHDAAETNLSGFIGSYPPPVSFVSKLFSLITGQFTKTVSVVRFFTGGMKKKNIKIIAPIVALAVGAAVAFAGCEGPMGPAGPAGEPGKNGQDGTNGTNGQDGKDGQDGAPGQPFESELSKTIIWAANPDRKASTWGLPIVPLQPETMRHFINNAIKHFENNPDATRQSAVDDYETLTGTLIM